METPKNNDPRGILEIAAECTSSSRRLDYGRPEDNFELTANFWNVWMQTRRIDGKSEDMIMASDIPILMVLLKVAREAFKHKRDNLVDIAGYVNTLDELYGHE